MTKIASNSVWGVLCGVMVLLCGAASALGQAPQLLAHSSGNQAWLAVPAKDANGAQQTILLTRGQPGQGWRLFTRLPERVTDLADWQSNLAVLFDDGDWMLLWQQGGSSGASLPAHGRLLRLASGNDTLWAVGAVPGGMATLTTRPATTSSLAPERETAAQRASRQGALAASSQPTTLPSRLVLFQLDRQGWTAKADLPAGIESLAPGVFSAAVSDEHFIMATAEPAGSIRIRTFAPAKGWMDQGTVQPGVAVSSLRLMASSIGPLLWVAPESGAGMLYRLDQQGTQGVELRTSMPVPQGAGRAVTTLGDRILLLFTDQGKLFEQAYDLNGSPSSQTIGLGNIEASGPQAKLDQWLNIVVMAVLAIVFLSALGRRRSIQDVLRHPNRLPLAALWARFAAGLVDAAPWLAVQIIFIMQAEQMSDPRAILQDPRLIWWSLFADAVYIGHCMTGELLFGRSLGKWMFGLKVVRLDGQPPRPGAIVVRNLLRLVDVITLLTLTLVLFSPLRQRVGDIAAGTLVVEDTSPDSMINAGSSQDEEDESR